MSRGSVDGMGGRLAQEDEATRALARHYGVMVWFGRHTREWWAMVDNRVLVGARCPEQLGHAIAAAQRGSRTSATRLMSRPDGPARRFG